MEEEASTYELFARCASGFEGVLADELRALGASRVRPLKGGVSFFGSMEDAYRACLWSRLATRIQMVLARCDAHDAEALYAGAKALPWEEYAAPGSTIALQAHGQNKQLRNTQFSALKAKDALCDRLRERRGSRPNVDAKNPDFAVDLSINRERATVYLNLSGPSLHRRGYREEGMQVAAPMKETLAAGMLLAAGWQKMAAGAASGASLPGNHPSVPGFVDPMCGSGTLVIEAALIAANLAPGLLREHWGFEGCLLHDASAWARVRDEARWLGQQGIERARQEGVRLVAGERDARAMELAQANAQRAGVADLVDFFVCDAARLPERWGQLGAEGMLVTNPPYGQRLLAAGELDGVYAALSRVVEALPVNWGMALISSDDGIDAALGQSSDTQIACYNGPIEARVHVYRSLVHGQPHKIVSLAGAERTVHLAEANSKQFADRLRKVAKERFKWARKEGVGCLRLYDADLPDYALSVDLYKTCTADEAPYARIAEYQAPSSVDAARAARRLRDALALVPAILDVDPQRVFFKVRRRAKGGSQYREAAGESHSIVVEESGYRFEVDLGSYLDTGLFLDHRITRQMLQGMAHGTRFLNLFAYTGAASVYAAGGGAITTTTVDLSQTYLAWAQRNMEANGFYGEEHRFVRADILAWLDDETKRGSLYDLVFCDPPTFSNSKNMGERSFDVQRDHALLLGQIVQVLAPGGRIVFSTNLRSFKLDEEALAGRGLVAQDLSAQTIPHDFERNPKIHRCYLLRGV